MKKLLTLLTLLLVTAGSLSAQDFRPAVRSGARSLNFTFGGFGAFGIAGAGVSGGLGVSYFASSDVAYRLGLQAVYNKTTQPWTDAAPGSEGSTSNFGLGLGVDYLMYMSGMTSRVRPYWGVGVNVIYNTSSVKPPVALSAGTGTLIETRNGSDNDGLTFGVGGILGAEFFLYPELSLSAEYDLNLLSLTSRADRTLVRKNSPDFTVKQGSAMQILGFGAAGATVHIYF
ncbi:MAG: outer membrane beta-barrel protein [Acidobacteriota bacterium]